MSRPPSRAVIEAMEQAEREHGSRWFMAGRFDCICGTPMTDGTAEAHDAHRRFEVARAAEVAALHALARWALADRESRTHDLQGETLIPTWVIRDRADALKETP